jgi:hypothetical protein
MINDSSLALFMPARHKKDGEERAPSKEDFVPDLLRSWIGPEDRIRTWKQGDVALGPDGKPYLSTKMVDSLLLGAVRRLDEKIEMLNKRLDQSTP